jgi:hypothetical protein
LDLKVDLGLYSEFCGKKVDVHGRWEMGDGRKGGDSRF